MRNYLSLSNLSESITHIIPAISSSKLRRVKKEMPFVVLNSDADNGFYVRRLIKEINQLDLNEQPKVLRQKALKNIETGDLIVFGDCKGTIDFDYRVETNPKNLDGLDGRSYKAYDIINDFAKVLKRLKKYAEENSAEIAFVAPKHDSHVRVSEVHLEIEVQKARPKYVTPVSVIRNSVVAEKVTIFDNWVKVGYNQYDIYVDLFGNELVYIDGYKFKVKKDRLGRKYLDQ